MFTNNKAKYYGDDKILVEAACLSTDTKPTTGIANGSLCLEMDTGKIYAFNEESGEWEEVSSSGGGGGGGGGSSDFSTATLTINGSINSLTAPLVEDLPEEYKEFFQCDGYISPEPVSRENTSVSIALYKGGAIVMTGNQAPTISGDITLINSGMYLIRGDCTMDAK